MKGRIRLVEEVSPSEVIPEEEARQTLRNAPPPIASTPTARARNGSSGWPSGRWAFWRR
jgi:hypothetical protein